MSWVTPTPDQVFAAASKEYASLVAVKGQDDLADILSQSVSQFRGAINSRGYPLDADGSVPPSLLRYVLDLTVWEFVTRGVPKNESIQTKERKDRAKDAQDKLEGILAGKVAVELPDGYVPANPRTGTWNSENKLIMRTHPVPQPSTQFQTPTPPTQQPYANPAAPADD